MNSPDTKPDGHLGSYEPNAKPGSRWWRGLSLWTATDRDLAREVGGDAKKEGKRWFGLQWKWRW